MKKLLSLILCVACVLSVCASCTTYDENEGEGPTIPVYLCSEVANFDPAYGNIDDAQAKILSLIYEGLYKYDSKGKVVEGLAKSFKILDKPEEDYYAVEIKIKESGWSDGTTVQAQDFIYAWQRILKPDFNGEAASLLFSIKNARKANCGECSIDDIGVTDSGVQILKITFEGPTDYEKFKEILASPMLVPLRETAVNKVEKDWASNQSIIVCNGPFCVRTYSHGAASKLVLERNLYYKRNVEKDSISKYVTPYRLSVDYTLSASEQEELFQDGWLAYLGEIALSEREAYDGIADVSDTMNVLTYVFNTNKEPFNDANVRRALSLAIDRQEIADLVYYAKPAEGIIAEGVFENGYKGNKSFREVGGSLLNSEADLSAAKAELAKASYTVKDIEITVRNTEVDVAVAKVIKSAWEELGFNVTILKYSFRAYQDEREYDLVQDNFLEIYESGDFGVISVDYEMFCTDAFSNLATFSPNFASGYVDMSKPLENFEYATHLCGYNSQEYTDKIEAAFAADNNTDRMALLHEAEEILMNDLPVMPVVELQSASVQDGNIKKTGTSYYGFGTFEKANLKDAEYYTPADEEE